MVHKLVMCPYCQGDQVVKRGKTDTGKQRYRCHTSDCAHQSLPSPKERKEECNIEH